MKKITLLTATALTLSCLGGQTITSQAASGKWNTISLKGDRVLITYGANCDTQELWEKLQECFPNITLPGTNTPGTNAPETEAPGENAPESDTPETDIPGGNTPETETPDQNAPDPDAPETESPDGNTPGNPAPDTPDSDDSPTEDDSSSSEHVFIRQVVDLVNAERAKEGLSPLTINRSVQAAAQIRAVECETSFSHTRPNGSSFTTALKEQNVSYRSAGENIAWGQRSPEAVMQAWMNSPGHRANIMDPNFTTIGVGYYQNANGTNYWCQLFTR